jgi:hypothetical protein
LRFTFAKQLIHNFHHLMSVKPQPDENQVRK